MRSERAVRETPSGSQTVRNCGESPTLVAPRGGPVAATTEIRRRSVRIDSCARLAILSHPSVCRNKLSGSTPGGGEGSWAICMANFAVLAVSLRARYCPPDEDRAFAPASAHRRRESRRVEKRKCRCDLFLFLSSRLFPPGSRLVKPTPRQRQPPLLNFLCP